MGYDGDFTSWTSTLPTWRGSQRRLPPFTGKCSGVCHLEKRAQRWNMCRYLLNHYDNKMQCGTPDQIFSYGKLSIIIFFPISRVLSCYNTETSSRRTASQNFQRTDQHRESSRVILPGECRPTLSRYVWLGGNTVDVLHVWKDAEIRVGSKGRGWTMN